MWGALKGVVGCVKYIGGYVVLKCNESVIVWEIDGSDKATNRL